MLTAAVLHALWNIAAKRVSGDGYTFIWWYNLASAVLWVPIGIVVLVLEHQPMGWALLLAPIISGVIHIGYQLALQTGYDRADLSVVYPTARGVGPMITMLVAILVLGERPGWLAITGALVIIAGIVVVASGRGASQPGRITAGLFWGGLTGLAIAGYTLWDNQSVTHFGLSPVPYFALSTLWQTALMTPGLARTRTPVLQVLRRTWRQVLVIAVLSPLAYILVLQAMRSVPVALVAPARESGIVVGSLLAWWLFGESNPGRRLLGAAIVLAGITLTVL